MGKQAQLASTQHKAHRAQELKKVMVKLVKLKSKLQHLWTRKSGKLCGGSLQMQYLCSFLPDAQSLENLRLFRNS